MQNKGKAKKPVELVKKPIIRGSWHGRDAWKLAGKSVLFYILVTFVYLFASVLFTFDHIWGRIIICGTIVLAAGYYLYMSGAAKGQTDAAFGEILYGRREEGKNVPQDECERSYHPLKGLFAVLVAAVPFMAFAIVFACMTDVTVYRLGALPVWTESLMHQTEFADGLRYYDQQTGMTALDIMRMIDRAMIMPFINAAVPFGTQAVLLMERLSPVLILIAPMGYAIGYAQGLTLRAKINTGIKMGDDKKKRKERKARKQRQRSRTPERLI